jgi:hypothetical protein
MQVFLPYSDVQRSLNTLDNKRLGKQRVEALQIIKAIEGRPKLDGTPYKGWLNHPCVIMWRDNLDYLKWYYNFSIYEWVRRGFNNTMMPEYIKTSLADTPAPNWCGYDKFHDSHKSNLLRKDFIFYSRQGWDVNPNEPYWWLDVDGNWYRQKAGDKLREYVGIVELI